MITGKYCVWNEQYIKFILSENGFDEKTDGTTVLRKSLEPPSCLYLLHNKIRCSDLLKCANINRNKVFRAKTEFVQLKRAVFRNSSPSFFKDIPKLLFGC